MSDRPTREELQQLYRAYGKSDWFKKTYEGQSIGSVEVDEPDKGDDALVTDVHLSPDGFLELIEAAKLAGRREMWTEVAKLLEGRRSQHAETLGRMRWSGDERSESIVCAVAGEVTVITEDLRALDPDKGES